MVDSSPKGCVAAGHPQTAEAASEILKDGGNAFDAILAAIYAACAAEPALASLGGGGFLLACPKDSSPIVYDFFVQTPQQRRPVGDLDFQPILANFGPVTQEFHIGFASIAVPGVVRGLFTAHSQLASLPMHRIVEPAKQIARHGMRLSRYQAYIHSVIQPILTWSPSARAIFAKTIHSHDLLATDDVLVNPELSDTLDALAREGDKLFYEGEIATAIEKLCQEHGGYLTKQDLHHYQTILRKPLSYTYRHATIMSNPPPSAGGALIAFGLALLKDFSLGPQDFGTSSYLQILLHILAETQHARAESKSDIEAIDDPHSILHTALLERYIAKLANLPKSFRGTTHISVMDKAGNAASATLSNGEGCGHTIPHTGIMLNNMLGEEDVNPYGFHQWQMNCRMSSMMAPTALAFDDGRFAVLGSGGSNRIRTAVLQVLINLIDFGLDPSQAVQAPRIHFEKQFLNFERGVPSLDENFLSLAAANYKCWPERNMFFGGVHTVMRHPDGRFEGAGDPRRAGVCQIC